MIEEIAKALENKVKQRYLKVGEIAHLLGVSPSLVKLWIKKGVLKAEKHPILYSHLGGNWVIKVSDFIEFLINYLKEETYKEKIKKLQKMANSHQETKKGEQ
jgi:F0F1-type ATP synthase delta subunit